MEADYYIAAGDQLTWGKGIERCGEILQTRGDKVYVLPGNHESADQIAGMCAHYGLHNLHERHFQVGKWYVAGLGYSNPTPFDTPGEYTEEQMAAELAKLPAAQVLICHSPPKDTSLDRAGQGQHFGSIAVRDHIARTQPA